MKRQRNSVKFALEGISLAIAYEQNFRLQWFLGTAVFLFMAFFDFATWQEAILLLLVFLVLSLELVNSALENVCDVSGKEFHHYKKIAKDFAAGSVLLISFSAALLFAIFLYEHQQSLNYIPLNATFIAISSITLCTGLLASLMLPSFPSQGLITIFAINLVVLGFSARNPQWIVIALFMAISWIIADIRARFFNKDHMA